MVVCKFWLENRCRYGSDCRFEHSKGGTQGNIFGTNNNWQGGGGGGGSNSQRVTFQNSGGNQFKWVANQSEGQERGSGSALDAVNGLPEEMSRWVKSKMWPFSCVSIEKDLPSLPEFEDKSPEEMRLEAYQCKAQGSMEPYIKNYQALASEFQNKRQQLQHMTMDLKQKLVRFVEDERRKKSTQTTSGFGQSPQSTAATGGSATSSLFGKPQSFGGMAASSVSTNQSLFGVKNGNSSTSTSVFSNNKFGVLASDSAGSSSGGSLFGKPVAGSSIFSASNQNNNQQTSLLGPGPGQPSLPGLFGGQGTGAASGQPAVPIAFGFNSGPSSNSTSQPTPNVFGSGGSNVSSAAPSQTPPNLFGKSVSDGANAQPSLLGPIPSQPPSLFGKGTVSSAAAAAAQPQSQGAPNLFGKPNHGFAGAPTSQGQTDGTSANSALFGKTPATQGGDEATSTDLSTIYTPLTDLTESEKAAFEAKAFQLGKIPLRPPSKELANVQ